MSGATFEIGGVTVTLTDLARETRSEPFGGSVEGWRADISVSNGSTMSLSQLPSDGDAWGIDAEFAPNGAPRHCNGFGARYLRVRAIAEPVAAWLNEQAATVTA